MRSWKVKTMGSSEKFCLRWNDFEANIGSAFRDLKEEKDFSDVTLVCADQQVEAHKVILVASSPFFKRVLRNIQHSHPLIYMKGVKFTDLEALLSFVYHGEVNVAEADLNNFLALAEELEVKGLTHGKNPSEDSSNHLPQLYSNELQSNSNQQHQPTATPQSSAQVHLQPSLQTEHECSASENNNAAGAVSLPIQKESESNQLMNNLQAPVENIDQYAGRGSEDFKSEREEEFDLKNYIEKISEGANSGQFKCNICGHMHSRKFNAMTHVENTHFPGLFDYSCDQCERKFNSRSKYYNHRSIHHSNQKQV